MTAFDDARARLSWTLQRAAAKATRLVPEPLAMRDLAPLRDEVADALTRAHQRDLDDALDLCARDPVAGRARACALAGALVTEHRARVATKGRTSGWRVAAASWADANLPTTEGEHVDDPSLPEARRERVIRAVDWFNRALGSYARFVDLLEPLLPSGSATVLDVASGHGGFPLALASHARAAGRPMRVIASDLRPEYLRIGEARARRDGLAVEFSVLDALDLGTGVAPGEVDVITCTQSLHHLDAAAVAGFLAEALRFAPAVLFVDAARSVSAVTGVAALGAVATLDRVFVHDAVVSVRRAFVREELALIARCVPGGDRVEAIDAGAGLVALRTRR